MGEMRLIRLWSSTWLRDSHGLYDYDSPLVETDKLELMCGGRLYRIEDNVDFLPDTEAHLTPLDAEPLVKITIGEGRRYVDGSAAVTQLDDAEDLWLAIGRLHTPRKNICLSQHDTLRLGRVRYLVKELQTSSPSSSSDTASSDLSESCQTDPHVECRICYERQTRPDNPLLSYCNCDGSVKFTHFLCLKRWIRSKVQIRMSDCALTYQWYALACELCKVETPLRVKAGGEVYSLMEFETPEAPYVVLETVDEEDNMRTRHVISFADKSVVRMGRGLDSDVRINDISVSRSHAILCYDRGRFLVEDCGSKFGTSLLLPQPVAINSSLTIQCGRSLLRFSLESSRVVLTNGFRRLQDSLTER